MARVLAPFPNEQEFEQFVEDRVVKNCLPYELDSRWKSARAQKRIMRVIYYYHKAGYDWVPQKKISTHLRRYTTNTLATMVHRLVRKRAIDHRASTKVESYRINWELTEPKPHHTWMRNRVQNLNQTRKPRRRYRLQYRMQ